MPKPYAHGGHQSIPGVGGSSSGYKKPSYTGANKSRGSSMGTMAKGAKPFRPRHGGTGGAKAGNGSHNTKPGAGPMASGSARGHESYPTKGTGARQAAGSPGATMKRSRVRNTDSHRPAGY